MVRTESQMLELGIKAPEFSLINVVDDKIVRLSDSSGRKGTLVFFICNHCPFVIHVRDQFEPIFGEYSPKGISFIAINSNSLETHPQDGPPNMKTLAEDMGWEFPFLFDKTQEVAKAYGAACTPDFFLFDAEQKLYYRGQLDDSRPESGIPVTGVDLRRAMDSLLEGKSPPENQKPSLGCNIKWNPGNEPHYFNIL
ncbi:MAG: thioredoxin family protein [Candidatus Heimdallarchaeota archaeon]|nr:MAG: thioredoxin family protein [Candidatus Heimdallarchaeota archaeon]